MKVREDGIKPVGLTLLYEPDCPADPAVEEPSIVLVHGIGGHPVRSWKFQLGSQTAASSYPGVRRGIKRRLTKMPPETSQLHRSNSEPFLNPKDGLLSRAGTLLKHRSTKSTSKLHFNDNSDTTSPDRRDSHKGSRTMLRKLSFRSSSRRKPLGHEPTRHNFGNQKDVYWPLTLLPASCPNARVFTWGYHMLIAHKRPVRHQGDIFAHAAQLLVELASIRSAIGSRVRPIIFVAHSTGGILVKELLRLSEAERDGPLKEIVLSTSAVVFLGCPHRATEYCSLGDAIRSMVSVTLPTVDPNDPILEDLCGINSVTTELGRQMFNRLWKSYNFRVKTFQESVIPSSQDPELRAQSIIRRLSSFIGDPCENAETIQALHNDICKFGVPTDPGYRAVVRALAGFITIEEEARHVLTTKEKECLDALRLQRSPSSSHPPPSYPGTCHWLYDDQDFQAWLYRTGPQKNKVLWIKGESGCGKTVLLQSLRSRIEKQWGKTGACFIGATVEPDGFGSVLFAGMPGQARDLGPASLYRSLLSALFPHDSQLRKDLLARYSESKEGPRGFEDSQIVSFFADHYVSRKIETPVRRMFIFIDIEDEVDSNVVHEMINRLSQLSHNSDFSICVASSYYSDILEEDNVISIPIQLRNTDDVLRYVNLNLIAEWEERNHTVVRIGQKCGGLFLWAEIVVNILNAAILEGATQEMIEYTVKEIPGDLYGLYEWMLSTMSDREKAEALVLFQWAMLAAEPMRLNDLFVAIRLTEPDPFASFAKYGPLGAFNIGNPICMRDIRQIRNSEIITDTPYQLYRWLRARSIGLLELKSEAPSGQHQLVTAEPLGLQRVYPIHPSVRSFFLSGRGFACLAQNNPSIPPNLPLSEFIDISYYGLLRACLIYLNMRDFEPIGHGSRQRKPMPHSPMASSPASTLSPTTLTLQSPPHLPSTLSSHQQRHLILASYAFLTYAVTHLVYHLLAPSTFRYHFPQSAVLAVFAANRFRLWKRWTSLLGSCDPAVIMASHSDGDGRSGVMSLLSPVFGARFRLERVWRKLAQLAAEEDGEVPRLRGIKLNLSTRPRGPASDLLTPTVFGSTSPGGIASPSAKSHKSATPSSSSGSERDGWKQSTLRYQLPAELSLPMPDLEGGLLTSLELKEVEKVALEEVSQEGIDSKLLVGLAI